MMRFLKSVALALCLLLPAQAQIFTPPIIFTGAGGGGITYATWDPAHKGAACTLTGANLIATVTIPATGWTVSNLGRSSQKYYWEITASGANAAQLEFGIADSTYIAGAGGQPDLSAHAWIYYGATGSIYLAGSTSTAGPTFGVGDIISIAYDAGGGKIWFAKNGTWILSGNPGTGANPVGSGLSGTMYAVIGEGAGASAGGIANFGATAFTYSVPSGFNSGLY